jgi:hypothetical protein
MLLIFVRFFCVLETNERFSKTSLQTIVVYLMSSCVNWVFLAQLTHERVEYNVFLFDEPFKGSKSLKIFKIS